MKFSPIRRVLCSVSAVSFVATGVLSVAHAQSVSGEVTRDDGAQNLSGVVVSIPALGLETTTGSDGTYVLDDVPAGTYRVDISFRGELLETRQVTVGADGATLSVNLDQRTMDTVIVTGRRGAIQSAAALEREADEFKSIVTADDIGNFGDPTVAESLQRIPGLSINRDDGEGQQVSIRGLPTEFATVTLNGARLGTSDPDRNSTQLDFFSADGLSQIEVTKTLTPEQDADAIAGSVDLQTISALTRGENTIGGRVEYAYQDKAEEWNPRVSGQFTRVYDVDNGRIGIAGNVTWQDRQTITDEAEIGDGLTYFIREEYDDDGDLVQEFFQDGDPSDCSDDQEGGTILECYLTPNELDLRSQENERENLAFNGQIEWQTTNHLFQLRGSYADNERVGYRNRITFDFSRSDGDVPDFSDPDDPDVDEVVSIGADENGNLFGVFEDGRSERRLLIEDFEEQIWTLGFEGTSEFGENWTANYGFDLSSNELSREAVEGRFRSDNITMDFSNGNTGGMDIALSREVFDFDDDDPDPTTAAGFPIRETDVDGTDFSTPNQRLVDSEDTFDTYYANLERRFSLFDRDAALKVGAKYRERERVFDATRVEYLADAGLSLADFRTTPQTDRSDLDIPFDVDRDEADRVLSELISGARVATVQERGTFIAVADTESDYSNSEEVFAGYAQLTFNPADNFQVIAGFRVEDTDYSSTGNRLRIIDYSGNVTDVLRTALTNGGVDEAEINAFLGDRVTDAFIEPFTGGNSYTDVFPSINLRWEPTEDTVVRASYTEGIKRPEFGEAAAIVQLTTNELADDDILCGIITGDGEDCPGDIEDDFMGVLTSVADAQAAYDAGTVENGGRAFETEAGQFRNPALEPLTSQNFDISLAWYPNPNTVLSVAAFHKEIENFILRFSTSDPDAIAEFGFPPDTFLIDSPGASEIDQTFINGDSGWISGIELSYYQAYTFLPQPFDGLFTQANVTFGDSNASSSTVGRDIPFPDQSDIIGNLSLGWENDVFSLRAAAVYQGERLRAVNAGELDNSTENTAGDELEEERTQIDISARWEVRDGVQVYLDAINITDAEDNRVFRGDPDALNGALFSNLQNYGATYQFGVRFEF